MRQSISYTFHKEGLFDNQIQTSPTNHFDVTVFGEPKLITKKIVTPRNSKRIGRVICENLDRNHYDSGLGRSLFTLDTKSTISINVDGFEVLKDYPLRWICPKLYAEKSKFRFGSMHLNPRFNFDVDERAEGSELEISIFNNASVIVHVEYDDEPLNPIRKRINVETLSPIWQYAEDYTTPNATAWRNVMRKTYPITLDKPAKSFFCEFRVDNYLKNLYDLTFALNKKYQLWTNEQTVVRQKDWMPASNIVASSTERSAMAIKDILNRSLISIMDQGRTLLKDSEVSVFSVSEAISPEEANFDIDARESSLKVVLQSPIFLNEMGVEYQNELPFTSADLQVCFINQEKR